MSCPQSPRAWQTVEAPGRLNKWRGDERKEVEAGKWLRSISWLQGCALMDVGIPHGAAHQRKMSYLEKPHRAGAAKGASLQGQECSSAGPPHSEEHTVPILPQVLTSQPIHDKTLPHRGRSLSKASGVRGRPATGHGLVPVGLGQDGQALPWKVSAL